MNQKSGFFQDRGALPLDAPSYVPRAADDQLFEACVAGRLAFVLAPRQTGKSSLVLRTQQRLREAGIATVFVDLSSFGTDDTTPSQWYLSLLLEICEQASIDDRDVLDWWESRAAQTAVKRFTQFLERELPARTGRRVVVMIDEIDSTLRLPFSADDFFAALRYLWNARARTPKLERLSFVLIGVASPNDLIHDPARTPFNIGEEIQLDDLGREEAKEVLRPGLAAHRAPEEVLDEVLSWTEGHPRLTQAICSRLTREPDSSVEEIVDHSFFGLAGESDSTLREVRRQAESSEQARNWLRLYRRILQGRSPDFDPNSDLHHRLCLTGLVRGSRGEPLQPRNRVLAHVFDLDWIRRSLRLDPAERRARLATVAAVLLGVFLVGFVVYDRLVAYPRQLEEEAFETADLFRAFDRTARLLDFSNSRGLAVINGRIADILEDLDGVLDEGSRAKLQRELDSERAFRADLIAMGSLDHKDPALVYEVVQACWLDMEERKEDDRLTWCAMYVTLAGVGLITEELDPRAPTLAKKILGRITEGAADVREVREKVAESLVRCQKGIYYPGKSDFEFGKTHVGSGKKEEVGELLVLETEVTRELYRMFDPSYLNHMKRGGEGGRMELDEEKERVARDFGSWFGGLTESRDRDRVLERFEGGLGSITADRLESQLPATQVSWYEAATFADWIGGRIPDEVEMGYLMRGYHEDPEEVIEWYPANDPAEVRSFGWIYENSRVPGSVWHAWPVGLLEPTAFGLYDLYGNAWEWCTNAIQELKAGRRSVGSSLRDLSGGFYISSPISARATFSRRERPSKRLEAIGFRIVYDKVHPPPEYGPSGDE